MRRRAREHAAGADELGGRGAGVHLGVVQDEVFEMRQPALDPQRGAGVGKMRCVRNPPLPDRAGAQPLVEPGERVLGLRQRERRFCAQSSISTIFGSAFKRLRFLEIFRYRKLTWLLLPS